MKVSCDFKRLIGLSEPRCCNPRNDLSTVTPCEQSVCVSRFQKISMRNKIFKIDVEFQWREEEKVWARSHGLVSCLSQIQINYNRSSVVSAIS